MNAADLWAVAMTPEAYMAQMTENRDLFEQRIAGTTFTSEEIAAFAGAPLRVLAITEDFCGDSAQFIPPLIRLARELDTFDVAILLRPEHREFANGYRRRDGYQAIPVLIVLDEQGNELGFLIERPERAYPEMADETRRFLAEHPELEGANRAYQNMPEATKAAVRENMTRFRNERQEAWTRWLLEDLAAIVARAAAPVSR